MGEETEPAYFAKVIGSIENSPGTWNSLRVGVFRKDGDSEEQVGEYTRNYSSLLRTFQHFRKNGRDYALYSRDYTATRVMELPSCKDLGGEERDGNGFCPVDYYVPWEDQETALIYHKDDKDAEVESKRGVHFGFVSGCVWGDDSSWKLQYLDLSRVEAGIIEREERFGYLELPRGINLEDAIDMESWDPEPAEVPEGWKSGFEGDLVQIAILSRFHLSGKPY